MLKSGYRETHLKAIVDALRYEGSSADQNSEILLDAVDNDNFPVLEHLVHTTKRYEFIGDDDLPSVKSAEGHGSRLFAVLAFKAIIKGSSRILAQFADDAFKFPGTDMSMISALLEHRKEFVVNLQDYMATAVKSDDNLLAHFIYLKALKKERPDLFEAALDLNDVFPASPDYSRKKYDFMLCFGKTR